MDYDNRLTMREKFQGLGIATTLSLATAVCALFLSPQATLAGDKIEFSPPGSSALAQKPQKEMPEQEELGSEVHERRALRAHRYELPPPTITIIVPASRNPHDGLHAWDTLDNSDQDNASDDSLAQPQSSSVRTNFVGGSWDLRTRDDGFGISGTGQDSTASGFRAPGYLSQMNSSEDDSGWRGDAPGGGAWMDGNARGKTGQILTAHNAGVSLSKPEITAWDSPSSTSPLDLTDDNRFGEGYRTPSRNGDFDPGAPGLDKQPLTSTAALGMQAAAALDAHSMLENPFSSKRDRNDTSIGDSSDDTAQRGGYRAYPTFGAPIFSRSDFTPPSFSATATASKRFSEQPAVLPFPRKPGSILQ